MRTLALLLLVACGGHAAVQPNIRVDRTDEEEFDELLEQFYEPHFRFRPGLAIELGYHEYDGQVPDRSPEAIAAEIERLHHAEEQYANAPPSRQVEQALVLAEIRRELFDLEVRRRPNREVFYYVRQLPMLAYIARDYAPLVDRARAMLATCEGAPGYFAQMDANLDAALPKPGLEAGIMMLQGQLGFVTQAAPAAFAELDDETLAYDLNACFTRLADALGKTVEALKARLPAATTEFALGEDTLLAMLRASEGIELTYDQLADAFLADQQRNEAAILAAAAKIDPKRDPHEVIAEVSADVPTDAIADASADLVTLQRFVEEHDLLGMPSGAAAEVRESPPFLRGNFAFLSMAGPFETAPLPSFFYLALPFPMSREDLVFVAAHEVWPGHFVQNMHERDGARVFQTFESYTTSEGWAHYVEEMIWDAGFADGDPRAEIGLRKSLLLRDVRALVALGYHARGMTVDEAIAMFTEQAFADPVTAKQQAIRGTGDPLFFSYTLGKLIIEQLRDDWMAAHPGGTLREFHDAFLGYGEAPLPAIRRAMLGDADNGTLL